MSNEEATKLKKVKKSSRAPAEDVEETETLKAAKKVKKSKKIKNDTADSAKPKPKKRSAEQELDTADQPPKKAKKEIPDLSPTSEESEDTAVIQDEDVEEVVPDNPLAVDKFPLSDAVKAALKEKQITALFDIQAQTLSHVLAGKDLLGRARTGCGKTLAFVLPIVETLAKTGEAGRPAWGRAPRVIVLAPTRELAKQVHADFDFIGKVFRLACVCIYGGAAYGPQEGLLRRGSDVVVGTPGRVKDMLEKGVLKLGELQFRVLDECDEMLNMGFVEDVEKILNAGGSKDIQTLLFSATLPPWVKDIQKRFLKPDFQLVDLVGNEKQKASTSVKHLLLPCHWKQRTSIAGDCVRTYGAMGRTIVFTDTKRDANEMAIALDNFSARPLHGDIPQSTRETTLAGFRAGNFKVLVATDVAARGLDISGVELVLQCEPPKDPENYIHRSGRTGRAGCTGISLTLVDKRKEGLIPFIERKAGLKFERVGAPQVADMAQVAGTRAAESLREVDDEMLPYFNEAAGKLLQEYTNPAEALARALAKIAGHTKLQARSLLNSRDNFTTLQFHGNTELQKPGYVFAFLKRRLPENIVEELQGMTITKDGMGAVFDVPSEHVKDFLAKCPAPADGGGSSNLAQGSALEPYLTAPTKLPELKAREGAQPPPSFSEGSRFGGRGGGRFSQNRRGGGGGGYGGGGSRSGGQRGGSRSGGYGRGRRF